MVMEFDERSEQAGGTPRRRWAAGLAAAMLVAAAGGVGFGIGYAIGDDGTDRITDPAASSDDQVTADDPVSTTAAPAPSTAPAIVAAPEPATTDAALDQAMFEDSGVGSDSAPASEISIEPYWSEDPWAPMEVVYSRTTDAGLNVRLQQGQTWPPYTDESGYPSWTPPAWCQPAGQLRVSITGDGVVDVGSAQWYSDLFEGRAATLLLMGSADAQPHRILVVQTTPDVDAVSVTYADGGSDATATVDGLAVLAVPGLGFEYVEGTDPWAQSNDYEVTLSAAGSEVIVPNSGFGVWDNPDYQASCQPPPPALPAAGDQPADPASAEDEIRAAMAALYGGGASSEDNAILLDDPTGVGEARQQVRDEGFEAEAASAEAIIEELVFTTPEEAWFRYRIETSGLDLDNRYGMAVVVDGTWRITRDTVCQDLAMAGGDCGDWQPIFLPGS